MKHLHRVRYHVSKGRAGYKRLLMNESIDTTSWVDRFFSNVMEGDNGSDDSEEEEEEEEEEDADFITGFAI